ncbi:MAG: Uncharacterised protein [SAR116 cluster bacterium]|nr:MAG: Uncharacterised protein [SAR116 cluster bacterium]
MQQRCDYGIFVKPHINQDVGDGDGMGKVRLTRCPHLAIMRIAAECESPAKALNIDRGVVSAHPFNDGISCSDHPYHGYMPAISAPPRGSAGR